MEKPNNLVIEGATIKRRNFEGREDTYNAAGQRNFRLVIPDDDEVVEQLRADGWNVKEVSNSETGEHKYYYILVKVSYKFFSPKICVISNGRMYNWNEEDIDRLDSVEYENIDLEISGSLWQRPGGKEGITAYLRELYITLKDSKLSEKYSEYID